LARNGTTALRNFQSLRDGPGNPAPSLGLDLELLSARLGQTVVPGTPVSFRFSPEGRNPALVLHAMKSREERARLYDKGASGDLLDPARDSQPVHLACN